jgi:hypothetical protein
VIKRNLGEYFSEKFTDVWKLLSDTNLFLSQAGVLERYDDELRNIRSGLQKSLKNPEAMKKVREEIVKLRSRLRYQGYDLSLSGQSLLFDGFRHDDAQGLGFKRLVVYITDAGLFWRTGSANHNTLAGELDRQLEDALFYEKNIPIKGRHYLWYLRQGKQLILSGADTELKEDYRTLKARGEANPLFFLSGLKMLR